MENQTNCGKGNIVNLNSCTKNKSDKFEEKKIDKQYINDVQNKT